MITYLAFTHNLCVNARQNLLGHHRIYCARERACVVFEGQIELIKGKDLVCQSSAKRRICPSFIIAVIQMRAAPARGNYASCSTDN